MIISFRTYEQSQPIENLKGVDSCKFGKLICQFQKKKKKQIILLF